MSDHYVLRGHEPVKFDSVIEWARAYDDSESRRVDRTNLDSADVSTVFLGIDHRWGEGPPLLFETMVFGGPHSDYQERYSTWDEAQAGHDRVVANLKAGKAPDSP